MRTKASLTCPMTARPIKPTLDVMMATLQNGFADMRSVGQSVQTCLSHHGQPDQADA